MPSCQEADFVCIGQGVKRVYRQPFSRFSFCLRIFANKGSCINRFPGLVMVLQVQTKGKVPNLVFSSLLLIGRAFWRESDRAAHRLGLVSRQSLLIRYLEQTSQCEHWICCIISQSKRDCPLLSEDSPSEESLTSSHCERVAILFVGFPVVTVSLNVNFSLKEEACFE